MILSILFLFNSSGFCDDKFIIKPFISSSYQIDSNFFRTKDSEREVRTFTVSPGIEFGYQTAKSSIYAKGHLNQVWYDDLDTVPPGLAESDENEYTGHNLVLSADSRLFTRISVGVDNTWINTRVPEERDALDNFTDVNEYTLNIFRPQIKYRVSDRFALALEYKNKHIDYHSDADEDSSTGGVTTRLLYELNRRTTMDLEYRYWKNDYDLDSSDYTSDQYRVNLSRQMKYFNFKGGIGYHKREFEDADLDDIDTLSWSFNILGRNPPNPDAGERPRSYMQFRFEQNFNDAGEGDEYYIANRVSLNLGHLFLEKIDARIEGYIQNSDYKNDVQGRDDDTYSLSGTLTYFTTDRLTLSVKAGYQERDSNIDINDYNNTYALFKITFNYDLGSK